MKASSLLIVGHSHIVALGVPLARAAYELVSIGDEAFPIFGLAGGWPREDSDYWQQVASRSAGRLVAIFWRGNQHFHHFLIMPTDGFDFMLASRPELPLDPSRVLVPESAIRTFMANDMEDLDPIIASIVAAGGVPVMCGTPPPKGDAAFLREKVLREGYFKEAAQTLGLDLQQIELTPPLLLYKMWVVMQESLRTVAHRCGALFVPVPPEVQDDIGFLHPDCYALDATHANGLYGQRMLAQMKLHLGKYLETHVES